MQRDFIYLRDTNGNALAGVSLTFYSPGTTTPVSLYSPSSSSDTPTTTIANPVLTDVEGFASWAIPDGDYDVAISGGSLTTRTIRRLNYFDSSTFTLSGGGTVTSVALTLPSGLAQTGGPVTTNQTITITWDSVTGSGTAGKFLASPIGGGAGPLTFRIPDAQDIPNIAATSITSGTLVTARGGTGQTLTAVGLMPSNWGLPCKAVAVANVTVANPGTNTFDGIVLTAGQRLLLTGQAAPAENGPWNWQGSATPMTRPEDFKAASTTGAYEDRGWYVTGGTVYVGSFWQLTTAGAITIDTTGLTITQRALVSPGCTNNQVMYKTSTGHATSASLLYDGNNLTFGQTNPTQTSGMLWYSTTQQRMKAGVGTSPANHPVILGGVVAVGTVGAAISTAGQATTLTNSIGTNTFPANTLKVGSVIRFQQFISAAGLTATPDFALFLPGSVVNVAVEAMTTLTTVFKVDGLITVKTIGAGGTMEVEIGIWHVGAANAVLGGSAVAAVAVDTTAALAFDHKITLTGVAAGSVTPRPYTLELLS